MSSPNISIIITFHREGLLAYKTIRSVEKALRPIRRSGLTPEVIFHIDNGDKATLSILKEYANLVDARIYENSFGDSGTSRNFAIKKATSDIVSVLDGDDLVSDNWFIKSYRIVKEAKKPTIVHPEANLTFGVDIRPQVLWIQRDSHDKASDAVISVAANRWISTATGHKSIFLDHPYFKNENGYGNEDYWFNTETLAHGIPHLVAKGTMQFYRRKSANSVFLSNLHATQPYSELLDIDYIKTISLKNNMPKELTNNSGPDKLYYKLSRTYRKLRQNPKIDRILTPIAYRAVNVIKSTPKNKSQNIPDFILKEWRKASRIDNLLYPTKNALRELVRYDSETQTQVGREYLKLVHKIPALPNYVFIVPWVVSGGADKVLINYLKAFKELHPKWKVAVITTLPSKNQWAKYLPDNAYLIDFGNATTKLPNPQDQEMLFSRLIAQLKCKKLHIINSEYGYRWVMAHQDLIKNNYTLNISLFCHDIIPGTDGEGIFDYANPYLLEIFPVVNHIFTDNKVVIDRATKLNGFNPSKFTVEYQPVDLPITPPISNKPKSPDGKYHILWASRIATQKNPELLKSIANKLPPSKYQIDVYGRLDNNYHANFFSNTPTIAYHGAYNGIKSLDLSKYSCFLYTSIIDGLPNILLEISALGLPIIASDAGGVKEFIKNEKTGLLIKDSNNPEAYVKAIISAVKDPKTLERYTLNAQALLRKQHSFDVYLKKIAEDF